MIEVDLERKRISLSLKSKSVRKVKAEKGEAGTKQKRKKVQKPINGENRFFNNPFAEALKDR